MDNILASHDAGKLIHQIAGLALTPQNQNFAIRLEFLAQQVAACHPSEASPAASKGVLRNLIIELEDHWQVCAHEDPVIGYYVSEHYLDERIYRFFPSNTESPQHQFKLFAESTDSQGSFVQNVLGFTPSAALHTVLGINTVIAKRIDAPLYSPIPPKGHRPAVPAVAELSKLMDALVITPDEIAQLVPGADPATVRVVIGSIAGKQGESYGDREFSPDNHPLARRPILDIGEDHYLVTFPSLLFAAVRKVVFDAIRQDEQASALLDSDFRAAVVREVALGLRTIHRAYDPVQVCLGPTLNGEQLADIAVFMDRDKVMLVGLAVAPLSDCSQDVWAYANVGLQVDEAYQGLLSGQAKAAPGTELACIMLRDEPEPVLVGVPAPVQVMKLLVAASPFCSTVAGFSPSDDDSWLALPTDVDVISTGVECAQDFVRFLRGVSDLHHRYAKVNAYLLSDLFGMYLGTGRTFYQNVGQLSFVSVDPSWGAQTAFDQEKQTRWFRLSEHGMPIRGRHIDGERYGIVGEDRSWGAYAIDTNGVRAHFYFEPPSNRHEFPGVAVFTADVLSYYFPAILQALPSEASITQLPGYALICRVIEVPSDAANAGVEADSPTDVPRSAIASRSGRTRPLGNYTIEIKVTSDLYAAFGPGGNRGERLVVRTFLQALSSGVTTYTGIRLDVDALVDAVAPESEIRRFTVSSLEQDVENVDLGYGAGLAVHPYDESRLLDEVATIVGKTGLTERYPPLQVVGRLLRQVVAEFFARLEAEVKSVAGPTFARFAYDQLESTLFERVHETWGVVSVEASFDGFDPVKRMEEHLRQVGEKLSAQRFLLEMIACYHTDGDPAFSVERYLQILALCHVITELGSIADDIHFGLSIQSVELLVSGRFEFHRKDSGRPFDLLQQVQAAQSYDAARRIFSLLSGSEPRRSQDSREDEMLQKIDQAFISEYGYSARQLADTLIELSRFSVEQSELSTLITPDRAISVTEERAGVAAESCERILEHRSLRRRDSLSAGVQWSDVQPWRSYRQLSLVSRPFVRLPVDGKEHLLFGPKMLMLAVRQVLDRAASGLLTGRTHVFKKTMSQLANRAGRKLEDETAASLGTLGWHTRPRVKRKIVGTDGKPFWGEVDVLAWNSGKRRLIVVECKDLQRALNPYAFADELRRFYEEGLDEGFVPKLNRKVAWFKQNLPAVLPQIGETPAKSGRWRVKGMIVTDDVHLSAYVGQSEYQIVPLSQLTGRDLLS